MIRVFIGIMPPPDLQKAIETVRRTFAQHASDWRWVRPENVHLTLKFLGDIRTEAVDAIAQAMEQTATSLSAFQIVVRSLGCFPGPAHPRILWMGLEDAQHGLTVLYERLETALTRYGFSPETRPFNPHLTLARVQQRMDRDALRSHLQAYRNQQFGVINVQRIDLFQSQLQPQGAIYTVIRSVALQS